MPTTTGFLAWSTPQFDRELGLVVLWLAEYAVRGMAAMERARAALFLGTELPGRPPVADAGADRTAGPGS